MQPKCEGKGNAKHWYVKQKCKFDQNWLEDKNIMKVWKRSNWLTRVLPCLRLSDIIQPN